MKNIIRWGKKLNVRSSGSRRLEIVLRPSGLKSWLVFLFSRQAYHKLVANLNIVNGYGEVVGGTSPRSSLGLTNYKFIDYYELKKGDYSIDCELDPKCDGWLLDCKFDILMS